MRQLNKQFEYSPKVSKSAAATGQTERNCSLEGEDAKEDYEEQKLEGHMRLSLQDPYQRDLETPPPPSRQMQALGEAIQ